jgi:hypothetical protein
MKTSQQARAILAAAHGAMPPDDIAAHAVALAGIVASQDEAKAGLFQAVVALEKHAAKAHRLMVETAELVAELSRRIDAGEIEIAAALAQDLADATSQAVATDTPPQSDPALCRSVELDWPGVYCAEAMANG